MTTADRRRDAIARSLERIRPIEPRDGATESSLEAIKAEPLELAERRGSFSDVGFAPPESEGTGNFYSLAADDDGQFALYLSVGRRGLDTVPDRMQFDMNDGTCRHFPAVASIPENSG